MVPLAAAAARTTRAMRHHPTSKTNAITSSTLLSALRTMRDCLGRCHATATRQPSIPSISPPHPPHILSLSSLVASSSVTMEISPHLTSCCGQRHPLHFICGRTHKSAPPQHQSANAMRVELDHFARGFLIRAGSAYGLFRFYSLLFCMFIYFSFRLFVDIRLVRYPAICEI